MKVYLASPFFNDRERAIYQKVIALLREEKDLDVFVPQEHTIPNGWDMPNHIWAENVFAVDILGIQKADVVVVLNFGMYSDSGTAWECGYAYALNKKIVNVIVGEVDDDYSLMMLNGNHHTISLRDLEMWQLKAILKRNINNIIEYEQK
jgi:nucleoside 2-deoxyribosyltransferase